MATDLAIDNNGDLVFSGARDLMIVTGQEQVEQRIRQRLLLPRGASTNDPGEIVGSDIHKSLRRVTKANQRALNDLSFRVQEALAPMEEIQVIGVEMEFSADERQLNIHVLYQMTPNVDDVAAISDSGVTSLDILLAIPTEE
jgi:hypothetical protein